MLSTFEQRDLPIGVVHRIPSIIHPFLIEKIRDLHLKWTSSPLPFVASIGDLHTVTQGVRLSLRDLLLASYLQT